jgi:hypothetical protein
MIDLNYVEWLSNAIIAADGSPNFNLGPLDQERLARALLAVLPVVRAAENLLPSAPPRIQYLSVNRVNDWACHECAPGNDFPDKSFRCAPHALIAAFDEFRRQMQEGE